MFTLSATRSVLSRSTARTTASASLRCSSTRLVIHYLNPILVSLTLERGFTQGLKFYIIVGVDHSINRLYSAQCMIMIQRWAFPSAGLSLSCKLTKDVDIGAWKKPKPQRCATQDFHTPSACPRMERTPSQCLWSIRQGLHEIARSFLFYK